MLHGAFEAVAAKPTESFLSTVGKNHYGEDDPQNETRHPTVSLQQPLKHRHRGLLLLHECPFTTGEVAFSICPLVFVTRFQSIGMSSKIKDEKFSSLHRLDLKDLLLTSRSSVTGTQKGAVERCGTAGNLYPGLPTGLQAKSCLLFRRKTSRPYVDILMHRHGTIASLFLSDESPSPATLIERDRLLFITRYQTCLTGNNPDL